MKGPGKGHTNNPYGRPKGSPNKTTQEAREFLQNVLFSHFDDIGGVLKDMKDEDKAKYIDALNKLLQYVLPKKTDLTTGDKAIEPSPTIIVDNSDTSKELKKFIDDGKDN